MVEWALYWLPRKFDNPVGTHQFINNMLMAASSWL